MNTKFSIILVFLTVIECRDSVRVTVLSQNLYAGADFSIFLHDKGWQANPFKIPLMVDALFKQVKKSKFELRAQDFIKSIKKFNPDVINLQEVALWRVQNPGDFLGRNLKATTVAYDFLEVLSTLLKQQGLIYKVAGQRESFDYELPSASFGDIRYTNREACLVKEEIQIIDIKYREFTNQLSQTFAGRAISFHRGAILATFSKNGKIFRIANSHLENIGKVKHSQLIELAEVAKGQNAVIAADLNINSVIEAGSFIVAGKAMNTCCYQRPLVDFKKPLTVQFDYVLVSKNIEKAKVRTLKSGSTIPISDHLGILANLVIR